jgi:hypothetical protein
MYFEAFEKLDKLLWFWIISEVSDLALDKATKFVIERGFWHAK